MNTLGNKSGTCALNGQPSPQPLATNTLLASMLQLSPHVSDLIFSPGRPPQVELSGKLLGVKVGDLAVLSEADTHRIAMDIIGRNQTALDLMKSQGACDLSYSLGNARSVLRATSQLTVMSFRWMALWL